MHFAEEEGLIVRFIAGDMLSICPPLIIAPAEIDELFDRLGRALDRTLDWATRERLAAGMNAGTGAAPDIAATDPERVSLQ